MERSCLTLLLALCCIFLLPIIHGTNQAERLREFIKSQRSLSASKHDSSPELLPTKPFSPSYISLQDGMMEADKIDQLPGQPKDVDFDQYSGYVTVDPAHGRALFYYFVESPHNSSSKPLVLWLNGGPGCSSLGWGAMAELGPFKVNNDGATLTKNYYTWSNVANVIFLESPAGVGFSYSNTSSDIEQSGDNITAADSYTFLINWLERFPQYKTHDFFITGESYAGHYIPELAYLIQQKNKVTNQTVINLRGLAIGNAYVDRISNYFGTYSYLWSHALVSDETYDNIHSSCNYTSGDYCNQCYEAMGIADEETGDLDFYNIYAPLCDGTNNSSGAAMAVADPCSSNYIHAYLNNPAVQKALHANNTKLSYEWHGFSIRIMQWTDSPATVLPIVKELIASGIRFWLYSGDLDSVVPITDTRYAIKMLGSSVKKPWRPWYLNNEVGGYVEVYDGLTLATVRGAGHMVPSDQPERALVMISSFLQGQLPSQKPY